LAQLGKNGSKIDFFQKHQIGRKKDGWETLVSVLTDKLKNLTEKKDGKETLVSRW